MKKFLSLLLVMFSLLAVNAVSFAQDEPAGDARIRIAHFAIDAPAVDVYFNDEISAVQSVSVGDVSAWFSIPGGTYEVSVVPAGSTPDEAAIGPVEITVEDGAWYTAAAIGLVAEESLDLVLLEEDFSPVNVAETRINVFHAVDGLLPVDVLADGELLFGLVAYPGSLTNEDGSPNDGFDTVTLPELTTTVTVVDNVNPDEVLIDIGEFTFSGERNYFVAATGSFLEPTFRLVSTRMDILDEIVAGDILTPPNANASEGFVRVAHLSSGTPEVDIYIDGDLVISELAFASVTDFTSLPIGQYEVAVTPSGESISDAVLEFDISVGGADYITVVARGILANDTLEAQIVEEDFTDLDTGLVRISLFNAFPTLGPVDLVRDDGLQGVRFLAYPGEAGNNDGFDTVDLLAGVYDFSIVSSNNPDNVIAEINGLNWRAGRNYFIAVINGDSNFTLTFTEVP